MVWIFYLFWILSINKYIFRENRRPWREAGQRQLHRHQCAPWRLQIRECIRGRVPDCVWLQLPTLGRGPDHCGLRPGGHGGDGPRGLHGGQVQVPGQGIPECLVVKMFHKPSENDRSSVVENYCSGSLFIIELNWDVKANGQNGLRNDRSDLNVEYSKNIFSFLML